MSNPTSTPSPSEAANPSAAELAPIPAPLLGRALIGKEEEELVLEVLRSGKLFRYDYMSPAAEQGVMSARLEAFFAELLDVPYTLAVTSGTAALEVALGALGVGPGDEVIVPGWSWVSCFTAVVRLGALPVLAEVDSTLCLKPGEITRLSNAQTKAVIVVHYQGVAADMEPILAEARAKGVKVLEDCAESPGAAYRGKKVGSMGDISIFSFQYQKTITSGEGGLVATRDARLFERAIRMHDIGQVRSFFQTKITPEGASFCGSQFRITELTAAVALAQARKLEGIRSHCRALRDVIMARIGDLPGLTFRTIPDTEGDSAFEIYFFLETAELAQTFAKELTARGVSCQKMTGTYCHYRKEYCEKRLAHAEAASPFARFESWPAPGYRPEDFPITEALVHRFVALPLGVQHTQAHAERIAQAVVQLHQELIA